MASRVIGGSGTDFPAIGGSGLSGQEVAERRHSEMIRKGSSRADAKRRRVPDRRINMLRWSSNNGET